MLLETNKQSSQTLNIYISKKSYARNMLLLNNNTVV